jgi:hypothetical protein
MFESIGITKHSVQFGRKEKTVPEDIKVLKLVHTLWPAVLMFGDIAAAYSAQGLATPEHVEDAWEQFKRIEAEAYNQIESGLWD